MNAAPTPWWKRRRHLALAALALLLVALAVAVIRSGTSQIIIYNETGSTLRGLTVEVCGQRNVFPILDIEESVRFRISPGGPASSVKLTLPGEPPWQSETEYVESSGGYLVFIHIRPGLQVESHSQISFWQQFIHGRSGGSD